MPGSSQLGLCCLQLTLQEEFEISSLVCVNIFVQLTVLSAEEEDKQSQTGKRRGRGPGAESRKENQRWSRKSTSANKKKHRKLEERREINKLNVIKNKNN